MLNLLDWLLHFLHIAVIVINTTFWLSSRTLRLAQVMLVLTTISWFGFGLVYGFGYCFLTDWQWQVKEKLGESNLPHSYIKYALDGVTGGDWSPLFVDSLTAAVFVISVVGCVISTRHFQKKKLKLT